MNLRSDPESLRHEAYATSAGLDARRSLYDFQQPMIDLVAETIGRLGPVVGLRVADLGCGSGQYPRVLRELGVETVAVDLSVGMLKQLEVIAARVAADISSPPFVAGVFDTVLAMHVLHHLSEPVRGLDEIARILRPGGMLIGSVNGSEHLVEADQIWSEELAVLGVESPSLDMTLANKRLPGGELVAMMNDRFQDVEVENLRGRIVLHDAEPLIRYAASTTAAKVCEEAGLPVLEQFADRVDAPIRKLGVFRMTTEVVMLRGSTRNDC